MKKSIKNKLNEIFSDEKVLKKVTSINITLIVLAGILTFATNSDIYLQIIFVYTFIWCLIRWCFDKQKSNLYKIVTIIYLLSISSLYFFSFSRTIRNIILLILFFSLYILHKEGKPS